MWNYLLEIYEESRINKGSPECLFAETLIFNEGWLLRSVLKEWKTGSPSSTFPFLPFPSDVKVYSEGQLRSPFKPRFQGDLQAESHTHVDGIAGHFSIASGTKSGIELAPDCRYIAVFEAKIYSPLSRGVTHAPEYDQVSRTAACLIHALLESEVGTDCAAHVVVLCPEDNPDIDFGHSKSEIRKPIRERLEGYKAEGGSTSELERFEAGWEAVLEQLHVDFETWEEVLSEIGAEGLMRFYGLCKQFGRW
jgi:hypothetical protein